jgi:hypothetical protein
MTAKDLLRQTDQIEGCLNALKKRESELSSEIKSVKNEIDILIKTSSVLKHLLDLMVKDEMCKMANLITYGLKTIFDDQNLTFIPELTKKNEKIHIELRTKKDNIEGDFGSYGGSIAVIESFLLRLLCILKKNFSRLILLDETFASVGEEYIGNTSRFICELSKKLDMDILLVTHQKEFQNNADHVYRVKESENGLLMENFK